MEKSKRRVNGCIVTSKMIMRAFRRLQIAKEPLVASDLSQYGVSNNRNSRHKYAFEILIKLGIAERCDVKYAINMSRKAKGYKLINPIRGWTPLR